MHRVATRLVGGLLLSATLWACTQQAAAPDLAALRSQIAKGDAGAVALEARRLLQTNPNSPEARLLLGHALLANGDAVGAGVELRKALALSAPRAAVVPLLAQSMLLLQKHAELVEQFDTTDLGDAAAQDDLRVSLSTAWARLGKRERARSLVDAVLRGSPGHPAANLALARLEASEGRVDEAIRLVDAVVRAQPRPVEALEALAQLQLYGKRDPAVADATYQRLLALAPLNAAAHAQRVSIALVRDDKAAAAAAHAAMKAALPDHPQTRMAEAQIALHNQDHRKANDLLQSLLKVAPDNPQVLMLAGQTALELNAVTSAIGMLQKAVQLAPGWTMGKIVLARAYLRGGQPARSIQILTPLAAQAQPDADVLRTLAEAELMSGRPVKAEALYQRALKARPGDPALRAALAMTQNGQGQVAAAVAELRALARSEKDPLGDLALISVLMRRGRFDEALQAIDALATKLPGSAQPDVLRGQVRVAQGQTVQAREAFAAALRKHAGDMQAVHGLAALDVREGKPEQARQRYAEVLQRDPQNVAAMMATVQLLAKQPAARDQVAELLAAAIKAAPNDPGPRLLQIRMLADAHKWAAGLSAAQAAVAVLPDNIELQAALGRMQMLAGDANQAVSTLNKAAAKEQHSLVLQLLLADAYVLSKDLTSAERAYRRALELSPGSAEAQRGLIAVGVQTKNPARALEAAQAMQRQHANSGVGHLLEGDLHAQFNNWDAAVRAYQAGLAKGPFVGLSERLHGALLKAKGAAEADRFAEDWMKKHPEDAGLPFHLGNRAMAAGDLPTAERFFAAAHKSAPRLFAPLNNLAWVRAELGRPDAVALARDAVKMVPDDPNALDTLVFALTRQRQEKEAIEVVKAAVARAPRQPAYHFLLAKLYADAGDKQAARSQMDQLTTIDRAFSERAEVVALRSRVAN